MTSSSSAIWDFCQNNYFNNNNSLVTAINCGDVFLEKMLLGLIPKKGLEANKLYPLIGCELSEELIDEKFFTLDFFTQNQSFYILISDEIAINTLEYFINRISEISEQRVYLFFRKKTANWKIISNCQSIKQFEIKPINFWEGQKLIGFLMTYMRAPLPYDISQFLVEVLPLEVGEYIKYIKLIKTNFLNDKDMNISQINKLIFEKRVDRFAYSSYLGRKDFKRFYEMLAESEITFESLRDLFVFLQSHLIKLADTSFCQNKNRLSKYDKEVISHSAFWNESEIHHWIRVLQSFELMAKLKNSMIYIEFKHSYLSLL